MLEFEESKIYNILIKILNIVEDLKSNIQNLEAQRRDHTTSSINEIYNYRNNLEFLKLVNYLASRSIHMITGRLDLQLIILYQERKRREERVSKKACMVIPKVVVLQYI